MLRSFPGSNEKKIFIFEKRRIIKKRAKTVMRVYYEPGKLHI